MNAIIQDIMRPFGVTPRYAGFPMLVADPLSLIHI